MNIEQIEIALEKLDSNQKKLLLITYGHKLTVVARGAYEFKGPGVDDPRLLRDINEIQHRVYQAIRELEIGSEKCFSVSGISHWICNKEKSDTINQASLQAFLMALKLCNT